MKKKIFITSKVYDLGKQDLTDIIESVQQDLNELTKNSVKFDLKLISDKEIEAIFYRNFEYAFSYKENIVSQDIDIVTGRGLNRFYLPYDDLFNPLFKYDYYSNISHFERVYKRSAVKLGANRPKQINTDIYSDKVILSLAY